MITHYIYIYIYIYIYEQANKLSQTYMICVYNHLPSRADFIQICHV
jgi:hypothetical protein